MDISKELLLKIEGIKQQKVDFSFQKVISYSQFTIYQECPHRYKLLYIDKLKNEQDSNINFTFGTAFHNTLQNYLTVLFNESAIKADEIDLRQYLKEQLHEVYKLNRSKSKENFTTAKELQEYFEDGVQILEYIRNKRKEYFSLQNEILIGVEVPLFISPNLTKPNLVWLCHLDIVLYNKKTNTLRIIDVKTSRAAWGEDKKKDLTKTAQLVIYKNFFAKQYGFPVDNIEVEYFIAKRKLWENSQFPQKRIQKFSPSSGKNTTNKVLKQIDNFIDEVFDNDGKYNLKEYPKNTDSCKYCPFLNDFKRCDKLNK